MALGTRCWTYHDDELKIFQSINELSIFLDRDPDGLRDVIKARWANKQGIDKMLLSEYIIHFTDPPKVLPKKRRRIKKKIIKLGRNGKPGMLLPELITEQHGVWRDT
jgi:hypothetical protein